jgi:hypothetical protein
LDGSLLVDGSVVRGKLARESVLPENNGRGNSIRSFFANTIGNAIILHTVPVGKTFIVTDIVAIGQYSYIISLGAVNGSQIHPVRAMVPAYGYGHSNPQPHYATPFQAGIRFDSGEVVGVSGCNSAYSCYVTVSGYEF